jgi:long-chain acyl-CoA synthetase
MTTVAPGVLRSRLLNSREAVSVHDLKTLADLLAAFHARGEQPAILLDHEDALETVTYGWLAEHATGVARGLIAAGVAHQEPIAVLAPNSPAWIAAYFGIVAAGATAVPLDYHTPVADLASMLERSGSRRLFTVAAAAKQLPGSWMERARTIYVMDDGEGASAGTASWTTLMKAGQDALPTIEPESRASLLFTSGTTGTPKIVPLAHRHFLANVSALLHEQLVAQGERVLLPLPLHHTYPFTVGMLTSLAAGATLVMPGGATGPLILHAARSAQVSVIVGVPGLYSAIVNGIDARMKRRGRLARLVFNRLLALSIWLRRRLRLRIGRLLFAPLHAEFGGKLRMLSSGGSKLDPAVAWKLEGLGWQVLTGYGLTETAPILTFNPPRRARIDAEGLPIPGVQLRTVPVEGVPFGEVLASGPSVFSGYLDNPEANAKSFAEPGWFRTGDLGFIDPDGYLHITGRANETIALPGGKKLFPDEIEAHYADVPFIKEFAVLLHNKSLVGLVVPNPDTIRTRGASRVEALLREEVERISATLRSHERLTGYAITMEALPRTQLGKLKRHLLPEIYAAAKAGRRQKPKAELSAEDAALLARADVKPIWDWLVARYPDQSLTPDTSPQLDLGVDSLQWIELTLELQDRFGVKLGEDAIGRILSIRDLLNEATERKEPGAEPAQPPPDPARWLAPVGLGHTIFALMLYGISVAVTRLMFGLRVIDRQHVPADSPIVLAPNHASYLDPVVLAASFSWRDLRRTYWVGWSGIMLAGPIMRTISRAAQVLPIDVDRDPGAVLDLVKSALQTKDRLVWFPEGRRSPTGEITDFLPGIALVLERTGARAVPVHISGTFEALPRERLLPRPHKVTVRFGAPVSADELVERGEGPNRHIRIANALQNEVARLGGQSDRAAERHKEP